MTTRRFRRVFAIDVALLPLAAPPVSWPAGADRARAMSFRIRRVVVALLMTAILALLVTQVAFGASTLTNAWQAKVGVSGVNGTANVSTVTTGAGSIGLKLVKLRASSTLPVTVYKGSCASVGAVLFRLTSINTTSTGSASRTSTLTAAQVSLITVATKGTGKIAIRIGSGTSVKCGLFAKRAVPSPQAVVQAFYDWYVAQTGTVNLRGRPDLTPAFVYWAEHYNDGSMFGADPVLCGQGQPQWVKAGLAAISGSSATVKVTQGYGAENLTFSVKLTLGPTGWQISTGGC
jgi:hypothetical protein